jgi:hypothetical protein
VKQYDVLNVKNALVRSVRHVTECNIYSLQLFMYDPQFKISAAGLMHRTAVSTGDVSAVSLHSMSSASALFRRSEDATRNAATDDLVIDLPARAVLHKVRQRASQ